MFSVRQAMIAVAVLGCVMGMGMAFRRLLFPQVTITVINDTASPLANVCLSFHGGERSARAIGAGRAVTWRLRTSGGSGLTLTYEDATGRLMTEEANVYLEPNYLETVDLHVGRDELKTVHRFRGFGFFDLW
jgi:hypothetical protein